MDRDADKNKRIEEELKKLPSDPGVYLMHDEQQQIIYIGKAKNLKNRVTQYFRSGADRSPKIGRMLTLISYFEYIVTDSEVEALILENNLIKEHHPRYNTMLKDDKTYPYIKVNLEEQFPRLIYTRTIKRDKNRYFGPYPDADAAHKIIDLLNSLYMLRTCNLKFPRDIGKARPCLNYHIGKCDAPCMGNIQSGEYDQRIKEVIRFLEGNDKEITKNIKEKMLEASANMEYEKAGEYKELLDSAKSIAARQKMEYSGRDNRDVLGLAIEGFEAIMQIFFVRNGKLIGREHFYMKVAPDEAKEEIMNSFIKQYYSGTPFLPSEILLPFETGDEESIEEWLSARAERKVNIVVPKKGQKEKLVDLAEKNAALILSQNKEKVKRLEERTRGAVKELSELIGIPYAERIESYDISNISGKDSVGSMVVYVDGRPKKNEYRKFKIKTVKGPDDVGSMKEVLSRRLSHEGKYPDLILIDGGKGQVNAVLEVMEQMNISLPVCGMVKDDKHRTRGLLFEGEEKEILKSSEGFKLLTRIQDETHRFAIEYHRQLRSKGQVKSVLDEIEGVGEKRRRALIRHFKSIDAIKGATAEEIAEVPGMNKKAAENVVDYFKNN